MIENYLSFLENKGLINTETGAIVRSVQNLSASKLIDLIYQSEEFLPPPENKHPTRYDFFATRSMSGGPTPCSSINCRFLQLDQTLAFSSLYADVVWIPSPLGCVIDRGPSLNTLRHELLFSLTLIEYMQPLLLEGLVRIAPRRSSHYCADCYSHAANMSTKTYRNRLKKAELFLNKKLQNNVQYLASKENGRYSVLPVGTTLEDLMGDAHYSLFYKPKKNEDEWKHFRITRNPRVLSVEEVQEMGVTDLLTEDILFDVFHQNLFSAQYGTNYLTSRPVDLQIIELLNDSKARKEQKNITKALSHNIPTTLGLHFEEAIRLRRTEYDRFMDYRKAVDDSINAAMGSSLIHSRDIFFSMVEPEVRRLDRLVGEARRASKANLAKDLVAPSAYLGIGLFSGIVSPTLAAIATAVGGLHFVDKLAGHAKELLTEPKELRADRYYWLWKLNDNKGRHSR